MDVKNGDTQTPERAQRTPIDTYMANMITYQDLGMEPQNIQEVENRIIYLLRMNPEQVEPFQQLLASQALLSEVLDSPPETA